MSVSLSVCPLTFISAIWVTNSFPDTLSMRFVFRISGNVALGNRDRLMLNISAILAVAEVVKTVLDAISVHMACRVMLVIAVHVFMQSSMECIPIDWVMARCSHLNWRRILVLISFFVSFVVGIMFGVLLRGFSLFVTFMVCVMLWMMFLVFISFFVTFVI